jgi:glutamyl-tRNA reductase
MALLLVGTSHHQAAVELREQVAFHGDEAKEIARRLADGGGEAVALSTCNRTELYLVSPDGRHRAIAELERLGDLRADELEPALYALEDTAAAIHLFRVAAGLESLVPGEAQILGQVRTAYRSGAAGPVLDRLFRQALRVGKRVRTETRIGQNPSSVSSAAAELAQRVFGELDGRRVLVLGAGKTSELTLVNLISRGVTHVTVANRSVERAAELAARFNGRGIGLHEVGVELASADVVIGSTGSKEPVLGAPEVAQAMRGRRGRPIFFIDIAVPRDLDPAINDLDGCYLYDIDDLQRVVAETVAGRREEAVRAEAIVAEEAEEFHAWQRSLDVVPAISALRELAEEIRAAELARAAGRLGELSPSQRQHVETLTAQIVNKLLHLPTVRMKEAAATAEGGSYAAVVRHLFGLDDPRP